MVGRVRAYERGEHRHQHQAQSDGGPDNQRRAVARPVGQDRARTLTGDHGRPSAPALGRAGPYRPTKVVIAT